MVKVIQSRDKRIPAGTFVKAINDHEIEDSLEYQYYDDISQTRKVLIEKNGAKYHIILKTDEMLRVDIEEPAYRQCENNCEFCFINGLPTGLRKELYFRDDDYRLSFLFGNFLSLSNMREYDIKRIGRLKLSPLYVSVHTTNPELRKRVFKNVKAGLIMEQLSCLIDNDVVIHCQIVIIPGLTDGQQLFRSIKDLSTLYPGVHSIGVVPVGRTKYSKKIPEVSKKLANETIEIVNEYQTAFRKKYKRGVAYCADEFYVKAGLSIPDTYYYDDFPQYENGIGMLRAFINELNALKRITKIRGKILILTGRLALPYLNLLKAKLEENNSRKKVSVDLRGVDNHFFGTSITVSGLLSAGDFIRTFRTFETAHDRIVLPPNCTNDSGEFIDGQAINDKRIIISPSSIEELIKCLQS